MPAKYRIAILGDMLELGTDSQSEHENILHFATQQGIDQIILVGKEFGKINFTNTKALHFDDNQAAKAWLQNQTLENTAILIKGSRGIKLEQIV